MPILQSLLALVLLSVFLETAVPLSAQDTSKPASPAAADSIQQQLEELKQGQQRLLSKMEEIKRLLQEKAPRADFAAKPGVPNVKFVNVYREPYRGTNTAKVAIIEYSDFDCPFCGKYARTVFPRIDADYIQTGKVRYFFRDLPEPNQTNAWLKARAARCAGDQGKFWEMHEQLFAAQEASGQELTALAQALGLDLQKFNECLSTDKYLENIQRSAQSARQLGLFGTPAFLIGTLNEDGSFVNVKKVLVGAETYESIKSELEELLAAPGPGVK